MRVFYLNTHKWTGAIYSIIVSINVRLSQENLMIEVGDVTNDHFSFI